MFPTQTVSEDKLFILVALPWKINIFEKIEILFDIFFSISIIYEPIGKLFGIENSPEAFIFKFVTVEFEIFIRFTWYVALLSKLHIVPLNSVLFKIEVELFAATSICP